MKKLFTILIVSIVLALMAVTPAISQYEVACVTDCENERVVKGDIDIVVNGPTTLLGTAVVIYQVVCGIETLQQVAVVRQTNGNFDFGKMNHGIYIVMPINPNWRFDPVLTKIEVPLDCGNNMKFDASYDKMWMRRSR
jgi:hypothetical protein